MENLKKVSRTQWWFFAIFIGFAFLMQNCSDDDALIYEETQIPAELSSKGQPVKVTVCRHNLRKDTYSIVSVVAKNVQQSTDVIIDADGDGYVNANQCVLGSGIDCDDNDPAITRITSYQDSDGDGYGNPSQESIDCTIPSGYVDNNLDCDDTDIAINPGAEEFCNDEIDNDCDGVIDEDCVTGRTYVPDDNFEQTLIDLYLDDVLDDYVDTANINTVTYLDLNWDNISDLTGIEDFAELQTLECYWNIFPSMDLRENTKLVEINCSMNTQLISINVSGLLALEKLYCFTNNLQTLYLNDNINLTDLDCSENLNLTDLDISNNNFLINLYCNYNPALTCIQVNSTQLASIPATWSKDETASYSLDCGY